MRGEKREIEMGLQGLLEFGKENEDLGEVGREGNRVMVVAAMRRWEASVFFSFCHVFALFGLSLV